MQIDFSHNSFEWQFGRYIIHMFINPAAQPRGILFPSRTVLSGSWEIGTKIIILIIIPAATTWNISTSGSNK